MSDGDVSVRVHTIPDDNEGYARGTLRAMQGRVEKGIHDERVIRIARDLKGRTVSETLENDWGFLKKRIRYTPDPPDMERVMSARFTVGHGVPGDCDDMAVAAATVLHLQKIPCHFEAIEWRTDSYTHVICVADTAHGPIPFDLTMDELGDEHEPTKTLSFPIMAQVQTIDDYVIEDDGAPTIIEDLVARLQGPNYEDRILAYNALHLMYPQEMTAYVQRLARAAALRGAGIGDMWSKGAGWLGSVLTGGLVPSDVITSGIDFVAGTSGTVAAAAKEDDGYYPGDVRRDSDAQGVPQGKVRPVQFSLVNNYDETHPPRTVTSPVTFMEEAPQIYATKYPPKGNATIPCNYSSVIIPYEAENVPVWGPLKKINRGLVLVSFDNLTAMMSDYLFIIPTRVGKGFELTGVKDSGEQDDFPGYYTRTIFDYVGDKDEDAVRYDFVGMSPSDIPDTDNAGHVPDWTKSTAYMYLNQAMYSNAKRYNVGTQIPTTTPRHVEITQGAQGGGLVSGGGGGAVPGVVKTAQKKSSGVTVTPKEGGGYEVDTGEGGDLLGTLGSLLSGSSKVPPSGYNVSGTQQPLKDPNSWTEYLPWIIGGSVVLLGGILLLKK